MRRALHLGVVSVLVWSLPSILAALEGEPRSLIVKLRGEGPHAVTQCAERAWRQAEPLVRHTNDGSDSLDQLQAELKVRGVKAVFRRSDGTPFDQQRARLAARLEARAAARSVPRRPARQLAHVYRFELAPGVSMREAVARLEADPHVVYAQPNHSVDLDRLLNDPFLQSQGSWGQSYPDQWGLHAIDALTAWDRTLGEGVVVAVVDTGVDLEHPEIAPNLWVNPGEDLNGNRRIDPDDRNGVDDDENGQIDDLQGYDFYEDDAHPLDENGHGTHVAGIIAARGDNGIGIAGVAPLATIMPVRVFPPNGSAETDVVWRGVLYAGLNGADVINASFSCGTVCRSNPIAEDVIAVLSELGVAYVTSAGNAGSDVMLKSPERLRESIVVGSIQNGGELAVSSSFGLLVDVVAPGEDILSLRASAAAEFYSASRFVGENLMRLSGTSMAAPHVSGVAALLLAARPGLSTEDLRYALRRSAHDLGEPGHDRRFGAGRVDPQLALDSEPSHARAQLHSPLPGDTIDLSQGSIPIVASLLGGDLRVAELEMGSGAAPSDFSSVASGLKPPLEAREIARLDVEDYPDGAYVLRLRATTRDGREVLEFAPIALDRSRPVFVSPSGMAGQGPAIRGTRIVWAARGPGEDGAEGEGNLDLFAGRFGVEGASQVVGGPGDQSEAAVSRSWLAWLSDDSAEEPGNALFACRSVGSSGACHPRAIAKGTALYGDLRLSGRFLVVHERNRGLRACRLTRRGCELQPIGEDVPGSFAPLLAGRRVVWGGFTGLFGCMLDPFSARCQEQAINTNGFLLPIPVALSGSLLAFTGLSIAEGAGLFLCDLKDAGCSAASRVAGSSEGAPDAWDLSDGRLVWHDVGAHGQTDVFFCEYEPTTGSCPIQTVTHDAAHQRNPRIHQGRVVWEDDRDGTLRIASFRLPELRRVSDRVVRAGRVVRITLRLRHSNRATEAPVTFEARLDGRDARGVGARLVPQGPAMARLIWRPTSRDEGVHWLRLRATRSGGLYSEQLVRLEVRPQERDD